MGLVTTGAHIGAPPQRRCEMFGGVSGVLDVSSLAVSGITGAQTATLFVSTDGDDGWSGKLEAPNAEKSDGSFATIARARDAIRAMKADGGLSGPVNVMVRGGTYFLDDAVIRACPLCPWQICLETHHEDAPGERGCHRRCTERSQ